MRFAQEMKAVFRIRGVGFSLPVTELLHIQEIEFGSLVEHDAGDNRAPCATVDYGGFGVPVFDLAPHFMLDVLPPSEQQFVAIVSGGDGPFGLRVDAVEGIFGNEEFVTRELPLVMRCSRNTGYRLVDLWRKEFVVHCDLAAMYRLVGG